MPAGKFRELREWKACSADGLGHQWQCDARLGTASALRRPASAWRNTAGGARAWRKSRRLRNTTPGVALCPSCVRPAGKVKRDEHGRGARDLSGKIIPFEVERHGAEAAAARQKYYALDARRRQQAAAYQAAWRKAAQGYRQASGNIVKEGAPASGGKSVGESLGQVGQGIVDVGKLLAAQQGPRRDIIDTLGRIESLLSRVLGVA